MLPYEVHYHKERHLFGGVYEHVIYLYLFSH